MESLVDNQLLRILLIIGAALVLWIVLRFTLKITLRAFRSGCLAIFVLAVVLFAISRIG